MLDTFVYLLRILHSGWNAFIAALSNSTLGFLIQIFWLPFASFVITGGVVWLKDGKVALMIHIKKTLLVAALIGILADCIIYGPVLALKIASELYKDHATLSAHIGDLSANLSRKGMDDAAAFVPIRKDLEKQVSDLQISCAGTEGENRTLNHQNRDQQTLIGRCQEDALKLLTPEAQKTTPVILEAFNPSTVDQNVKLILITNKPVTPVWLDIICDQPVKSGNVTILGSGLLSGGTDKVGPRQLSVRISTPAWTPISPMLATVSYVGSRAIACSFIER